MAGKSNVIPHWILRSSIGRVKKPSSNLRKRQERVPSRSWRNISPLFSLFSMRKKDIERSGRQPTVKSRLESNATISRQLWNDRESEICNRSRGDRENILAIFCFAFGEKVTNVGKILPFLSFSYILNNVSSFFFSFSLFSSF